MQLLQALTSGRTPSRIKNLPRRHIATDFRFSTFSLLLMAIIAGGFLGILSASGYGVSESEAQGIVYAITAAALLILLLPTWGMLVLSLLAAAGVLFAVAESTRPLIYAVPPAALVPAAMLQLLQHWEKAVVLRFGRYQGLKSAGLSLLLPFADRLAARVDTRIRVTDFSAERTLSRDNVPVHIDAICFWMIWDAQKAILEVQDFMEAVTLSAQTALRDAIGTHDLAALLSERDRVGRELQRILDAKTDAWGITILSVEFTDIVIPKELEDAMSKRAQADREHQARMILGETEVQLAEKMRSADLIYRDNPQAYQLRAMNMVYEGLRQSKGSMVLIPSSAAEQMNLGQPLGMAALQKQRENQHDQD